MIERSDREPADDGEVFVCTYPLAVLAAVVVVEIGEDVYRWRTGYETATGLPRIVSFGHLMSQTAFAFPIYFVLAFFAALVPAVIVYLAARRFKVGMLTAYLVAGIAVASAPSLLMLSVVHGLRTPRGREIFVVAHCLSGLAGGTVFWSVSRRRWRTAS